MSENPKSDRLEHAERLGHRHLMGMSALLEHSTEIRFLVENAIPERSLVSIFGRPESAKSWVGYAALQSILRGDPWLGFKVPPIRQKNGQEMTGTRRGMVLNFDRGIESISSRFKQLGFLPSDRCWVHTIGMPLVQADRAVMLRLPRHSDTIRELLYVHRPHVLLIDSLRSAHTAKENASEEMGRIMADLREFTTYGCTVIFIHHDTKTQIDSKGNKIDKRDPLELMRGSTEISAALDAAIYVKRIPATSRKGFVQAEVHLVKHSNWSTENWVRIVDVVDYNDESNTLRTRVQLHDPELAVRNVLMRRPGVVEKTILEDPVMLGLSKEEIQHILSTAKWIQREKRQNATFYRLGETKK